MTERLTPADWPRRTFLQSLLVGALPLRALAHQNTPGGQLAFEAKPDGYHVYPSGNIQAALEAAAKDSARKTVFVHAGTYRPTAKGQALIWFTPATTA
jgi:hypothetical protein